MVTKVLKNKKIRTVYMIIFEYIPNFIIRVWEREKGGKFTTINSSKYPKNSHIGKIKKFRKFVNKLLIKAIWCLGD